MWLIEWLQSIAGWWSGFWADAVPEPPAWASAGAGHIADTISTGGTLCSWFPLGLLAPIVLAVFAFWVIGFGLRVALSAASAATPGGFL